MRILKSDMKFIFIYIFLAVIAISLITSNKMGVSFDSKRYIVVAEHFKEGNWELAFETLFPHHPPFYPLVIAGIGLLKIRNKEAPHLIDFARRTREPTVVDSDRVSACRVVSALGFATLVGGVFLLGWHMGNKVAAHLASLLVLTSLPFYKVFFWCWSEVVYVPLSVLFLLCLFLYAKNQNVIYWLSTAFLAGLGFLTRFMGTSLIATGLVVVLFTSKNIKKVAIWGLIAFLPMLLYSTIHRTTAPAEVSVFHQCWQFLSVVYYDFGGLALILILLALLVLKVKFWYGISIYVGIYSLMLIAISSIIWFDPLTTRLLLPIYPFVLLYISLGLSNLVDFRKHTHTSQDTP